MSGEAPSAGRAWFALSPLNNQFPALHGLRVIAILGVIQVHVTDAYAETVLGEPLGLAALDWLRILSGNGWFVMDLFFLMSGFLIGDILWRSLSNEPSQGRPRLARFYARRAFRTFPLYYVFYFVYYALSRVAPSTLTPVASGGFTHITLNELLYLTNLPFEPEKYLVYWSWSLSVEEHFYLLSPLVVLMLIRLKSHRARLVALGLIWLSAPIVRLVIYLTSFTGLVVRELYTPTYARYDILVAGLALAYVHLHFREQLSLWFRKPGVMTFTWVVPVAVFLLFLSPAINPTPLGFYNPQHSEYLFYTARTGILYYGTLTSLAYACLVLRCIYVSDWFSTLMGQRLFLRLATLGYGVYLVHLPIAYAVTQHIRHVLPVEQAFVPHWLVGTSVTFLLSVIVAYALHVTIEKPALWLRDRLAP